MRLRRVAKTAFSVQSMVTAATARTPGLGSDRPVLPASSGGGPASSASPNLTRASDAGWIPSAKAISVTGCGIGIILGTFVTNIL